MKVYPTASLENLNSSGHPVFKFIEKKFFDWIEATPPGAEYQEKYFGEEAIYSLRGAVEQAIEAVIEEAKEENAPVDLEAFDFDAVFGD